MPSTLIETLPPSIVFLLFFITTLLFFEVGFKTGRWRKRRQVNEEKVAEPMIGGVLGLLAFVLAFSFNIASGHFEVRKQNVVSDANAISTAYLRAELIAEPQRTEIKSRLLTYAELRADVASHTNDLHELLARLQKLQEEMWRLLSTVPSTERTAIFNALGASLTAVFDIHEKRINDAIYNRMGNNIWLIIFSITFLSTFMLGVRAGFADKKSYVTLLPFTIALTMMVYLITDLDNPQSGMFIVTQQPMHDTISFLKGYEAARTTP